MNALAEKALAERLYRCVGCGQLALAKRPMKTTQTRLCRSCDKLHWFLSNANLRDVVAHCLPMGQGEVDHDSYLCEQNPERWRRDNWESGLHDMKSVIDQVNWQSRVDGIRVRIEGVQKQSTRAKPCVILVISRDIVDKMNAERLDVLADESKVRLTRCDYPRGRKLNDRGTAGRIQFVYKPGKPFYSDRDTIVDVREWSEKNGYIEFDIPEELRQKDSSQ